MKTILGELVKYHRTIDIYYLGAWDWNGQVDKSINFFFQFVKHSGEVSTAVGCSE